MLKLFQTGSCSRIVYFSLLLFLLAFDFAKGPVKVYLARATQGLQQDIYASGGVQLRGAQDAFIKGGGVETDSSGKPRPYADQVQDHAAGLVAKALETEAKSAAVGSIYISILVAMGFAALAATIWMVFARLRDIGWPAWVGFAILAPKLFLRLYGADLAPLAFDVLQYTFVAALIVLGFVPGLSGGATRIEASAVPVERVARGTSQFGRRGA